MKTLLYLAIAFLILRFLWRMVEGNQQSQQQQPPRENPNVRVNREPDKKDKYDDAEYVDYEEVE